MDNSQKIRDYPPYPPGLLYTHKLIRLASCEFGPQIPGLTDPLSPPGRGHGLGSPRLTDRTLLTFPNLTQCLYFDQIQSEQPLKLSPGPKKRIVSPCEGGALFNLR